MSAWNLIKAREHLGKSFQSIKNEPSNKLIKPMRPFFSTKKKRKQSTIRIAKPTTQEKKDLCTALLDKRTALYGSDSTVPLSRDTMSKCTPTGTFTICTSYNLYTTCLVSFRYASLDL